MTSEEITTLVAEIREDFQLPPYLADAVIERSAGFARARLSSLNKAADFISDETSRMLLKNYVYYDLNHRTEEFERSYAQTILSWQLEAKGEDADESESDG